MTYHIKYLVRVAILLLVLASCSNWDDHYGYEAENGRKQTLYDMIASNRQTSDFAKLVSEAGYEDELRSSQTFTVFAPTNEALSAVSDIEGQKGQIVENHIARYSNPTSTSADKGVRMLSGKLFHFDGAGCFAGQSIAKANELAANGVLHEIGGVIPYAYNLYEYIQNNPNASKLYSFIHRFDETRLDTEHSVEIGIDDYGRPVYDTVFVNYNRLLQDKVYGIGSLADEDSLYTMIVPNNSAWDEAYERISPYFAYKSDNQSEADSIQDVRTCLAIVNDLVYRGKFEQAAAEDSLLSTTGSIIHNPRHLFADTAPVEVSNGKAFLASRLNYDNTETWNKPVSVEAEEQNGRTYNNILTSLSTETVTSASQVDGISGDSYIVVMPVSTTNNPTVVFDIPNVLAGTYNIYAVFLPATVNGAEEELDSTKISFTISYQTQRGSTNRSNRSAKNITSGSKITKMLAFENFTFPYSDFTDNLWLMDETNDASTVATKTTLAIATNVSTRQYTSHQFSRTFRLDRIILEPVKN